MTRSRKRKLQRLQSRKTWVPLATALFAATSLHAQQAQPAAAGAEASDTSGGGTQLNEIVVTAQKRTETLQQVPISIEVLSGQKLADMQVGTFDDYVKLLPSVSLESFGPGQAQLYFRGIVSSSNGYLHSGPRPETGMYLDEIPITTIGGNPDLHMYDIQRVEALAGPQGTLYGASSLSGTLRVITNKPTTSKFEAGYDVQAGKAKSGDPGGEFEGFVNIPVNDHIAVRLVGYVDHEGGYMDNVLATRTYERQSNSDLPAPCNIGSAPAVNCPVTVNNAAYAKNRANTVDTAGGRAAAQIDLNDQWIVSPVLIVQNQDSKGSFSFDPRIGDLQYTDFSPDQTWDHWYQAGLTVEGKIGNFDLVYSGGYFSRSQTINADYSEYNVGYDTGSYAYNRLRDNNGNLIVPNQNQVQTDQYGKMTHEIRISSPADNPLQFITGLFYQRQTDDTRDDFRFPNLGDSATYNYSVPTDPGSLYLDQFRRTDRDYAAFGDLTWRISDQWKISGGLREFIAYNTLTGFFGFNSAFNDLIPGDRNMYALGLNGTKFCPGGQISSTGEEPCQNVNARVREKGETHRLNVNYQIDTDRMVYATYSTGFRPGGPNRRPNLGPYSSDTLTNNELGWKTTWFNHSVRFNGAIFLEKWNGVQLTTNGPNGITDIFNIGDAEVKGMEADLDWLPSEHVVLSAGGTYVHAVTTTDFCGENKVQGTPGYGQLLPSCPGTASAPSGTRLPITPDFKGNLTARYNFNMDDFKMHVQGAVFHQTGATSVLNVAEDQEIGDMPGFTTFDLAYGIGRDKWTAELFVKNLFDSRGQLNRNSQCFVGECFNNPRIYPTMPEYFGIKFTNRF